MTSTTPIDADTVKWLLAGVWSAAGVILVAVGALLRIAFRVGARDAENRAMVARIEAATAKLESVAELRTDLRIIVQRVEQVENVAKRGASDIRELRERLARGEGREEARRSNPNFEVP